MDSSTCDARTQSAGSGAFGHYRARAFLLGLSWAQVLHICYLPHCLFCLSNWPGLQHFLDWGIHRVVHPRSDPRTKPWHLLSSLHPTSSCLLTSQLHRQQTSFHPHRPSITKASSSKRIAAVPPTTSADLFNQPQTSADQDIRTPSTPLTIVSLSALSQASKHAPLLRRRSSYPPTSFPLSEQLSSGPGTTPSAAFLAIAKYAPESGVSGFGIEHSSTAISWGETPGSTSLLTFDETPRATPCKLESLHTPALDRSLTGSPRKSHCAQHMYRIKSAPDMQTTTTPRQAPPKLLQKSAQKATRLAQLGSDVPWKTILSSVVEVENVGEISVARVLQEVWKRGGGEVVSSLRPFYRIDAHNRSHRNASGPVWSCLSPCFRTPPRMPQTTAHRRLQPLLQWHCRSYTTSR